MSPPPLPQHTHMLHVPLHALNCTLTPACLLAVQITYSFDYAWASSGTPLSVSNVNTLFGINNTLLGLITILDTAMFSTYLNDYIISLGVVATDATGLTTSVQFNVCLMSHACPTPLPP
jgi:hypothetical protein